jgi:geranylgeranyl diphosphate synthase type I
MLGPPSERPTTPGACGALDSVAGPVQRLLARFLAERTAELAEIDPALAPIGHEVAALVAAGGKGLRPAFVYWGHRATGAAHDDALWWPAGAVELLHTFALIHDDVMDRSPTRRGRAAIHETMTAAHRRDGLVGDGRWFGVGGAILAGDLAFVWADELLDAAPLDSATVDRARGVFSRLRVEVMAGQFLDLRLAGQAHAEEDDARRVALLKSGRYTVSRPLQLGAAIGGGDDVLDGALMAYGDAVGLGFQLRDDILGLFGDPEETGKGATSDLREGKRTMLILRAMSLAGGAARDALASVLGDADLSEADADRAREIVVDTGALAAVEAVVGEQAGRALTALAPVPSPAREALEELADLALYRTA